MTVNHIQYHTDEAGVEYACRLRVYEGHRKPTVVVAEPLPESPVVTPIAPLLAEMVFGMVDSPNVGMWWVEQVAPGETRCPGAVHIGETWSMAWVDHNTVKGAMASPNDYVLNTMPVDREMVRLMILPNQLNGDDSTG